MTTKIGHEPEQPRCKDFSVNVNMEQNENQFIWNLPYDAVLNLYTRFIDAVYTILAISFIWLIMYFSEKLSYQQSNLIHLRLIISLYLASAVAGQILSTVSHIPPFVGMILVGMALQSSEYKIKIDEHRHFFWLYFRCVILMYF